MMLFTTKFEFITDIITNSSSELFVCNTDKTIEAVKEVLQVMLDTYNEVVDSSLSFDNCFGEVGYVKDLPGLVETYVDYKTPWNCLYDWGTIEYQKWQAQQRVQLLERLPDDFSNHVMICSRSDNTIPYELFRLIETAFNAERTHLG